MPLNKRNSSSSNTILAVTMLVFGSACSADDASPVSSVTPDVTDVGVSSDSESPVDVQAPDSNPGDPGDSSLQDSVSEPDSPGDTAADAIAERLSATEKPRFEDFFADGRVSIRTPPLTTRRAPPARYQSATATPIP